jgi:hypothetical protein
MKFHRLESHVVQSFMRDCEDGLGCIHGRRRRYGNGIRRKGVIGREVGGLAVPLVVEYDVFWTRYFFHLHKLQQVENARANLVKRESLLCCTLFFNVHIFVDMESLNLQVRQNKYAVALTPHTKFAWFMWISRVCSTRDWRTWGIYS